VGNNAVSYHGLGQDTPPAQDALNKLLSGFSALVPQTVNKGNGPPLNPWPFDSLNSVHPTSCHSHNDYDQNVPLFAALAVGCAGVEADVFLSNGDAVIGHDAPQSGRTLRAQYVEPLRAILDHNNGGSPGSKGVFAASPSQSLDLLIDFKSSDSGTLDAVVAALQPLRDGGYLSYFDGTRFVQRQVTVSCSGSAPYDRIKSGNGVPARDVFYDANLEAWDSSYSSQNSHYASADFKATIGNPGSVGSFSQSQKNKVSQQVALAHNVGLTVRYCKFLHSVPHAETRMTDPFIGQGICLVTTCGSHLPLSASTVLTLTTSPTRLACRVYKTTKPYFTVELQDSVDGYGHSRILDDPSDSNLCLGSEVANRIVCLHWHRCSQ
jgi:hypothetical protein